MRPQNVLIDLDESVLKELQDEERIRKVLTARAWLLHNPEVVLTAQLHPPSMSDDEVMALFSWKAYDKARTYLRSPNALSCFLRLDLDLNS